MTTATALWNRAPRTLSLAIGRCKSCKVTFRLELTKGRAHTRSEGRGPFRREVVRHDMLFPNGEPFDNGQRCWACWSAGRERWIAFNRIVGTTSADTCGAKCLSATGHQCECACGGQNHGSQHG